jgi:hypothetical protein
MRSIPSDIVVPRSGSVPIRLLAVTVLGIATVSGPNAEAAEPCSRAADHADDVTDANGSLYTDQMAGGRLDYTSVAFSRTGSDDLALALQFDDFTEPRIEGSTLSSYRLAWEAPGFSAALNIVDDNGTWSFDAHRTDSQSGIGSLLPEAALTTSGIVDEDASHISVLVQEGAPASVGDILSQVVVTSLEGDGTTSITGYVGDHIPNRNSKLTIDLAADCTQTPDPLRAWCQQVDDATRDVSDWLGVIEQEDALERIDLTRAEFLPHGLDLEVRISVVDLAGPRRPGTNGSRYRVEGSVRGKGFEAEALEVEGAWSATAAVGGQAVPVTASPNHGENVITLDLLNILPSEGPRYLVVDVSSWDGAGVRTPAGTVFESTASPFDIAAPRFEERFAYDTAIDVDVPCPWPA